MIISKIFKGLYNWFKLIWELLFGNTQTHNNFIEGRRHKENLVLTTKKRFKIINDNNQDSIITSSQNSIPELNENLLDKKFTITGESMQSNSNININPKFKVYGETRPKKCPYCLTANKITRIDDVNTWKCKECEHEW